MFNVYYMKINDPRQTKIKLATLAINNRCLFFHKVQ